MIRHLRSFICAKLARFSSKVLIRVIFSALLVSIIFYLKTIFFPDFSFLQVAYCVNVNDMALTTITPNPIEIEIPLDNQIEESYSDSEEFSEEERKAYKEALRKEKKIICIGFVTYGIGSFAIAATLTTCYYLAGVRKIC